MSYYSKEFIFLDPLGLRSGIFIYILPLLGGLPRPPFGSFGPFRSSVIVSVFLFLFSSRRVSVSPLRCCFVCSGIWASLPRHSHVA